MSNSSAFRLLGVTKQVMGFQWSFARATYAKKDSGSVSMIGSSMKKKKLGKLGTVTEKMILPVETDPVRLQKFCCGSNIYSTEGLEDVELKPDSEYPEWLWSIRTGPAPPLEELDPNSKYYWKRIRRLGMQQYNRLAKQRRF